MNCPNIPSHYILDELLKNAELSLFDFSDDFVELGYGKIVSHVYVENLPSLILKLKLGYLIEGTLRDHDRAGQHEYILGKIL